MFSIKTISIAIILLLTVNVKSQIVQINEVMSKNYNSIKSFQNKHEDWIEIFNNSTDTFHLLDYFLSDEKSNLSKWQFPNIVIIPDSFLLVFASKQSFTNPELHCSFSIDSDGETVYLSKNNVNIDSIQVPKLRADLSFGRVDNNHSATNIFDVPSPNKSNKSSNSLTFSLPSAYYENEFTLKIEQLDSSHTIYYTVDGSLPNQNSTVFHSEMWIEDRSYLPNLISEIRTSPEEAIYYHNWQELIFDIDKINVIKFVSFKNGKQTSRIYTQNYIVGLPETKLSTICLTIDSFDLFDYNTGIYVPGRDYRAYNPNGKGNYFADRIVDANITVFNNKSMLILNENCAAKIQGRATRASAQKSFKIYAKKKYSINRFNAPILETDNNNRYKRFVIRNTQGSVGKNFIADELAIDIVKDLNIEYSNFEFCKIYLNGEYWGNTIATKQNG